MIEQKPSLKSATIGIITALPVELAAARRVLGCYHSEIVDGRTYSLSTVSRRDNQGTHTIVVYCLPDMGNTVAAAGIAALLRNCPNVVLLIMCGIAGAVPHPTKPSDHVRLGDIVVTNRDGVFDYDHESVRDSHVEIRGHSYTPSRVLLNAARQLDANEKTGDRPWDAYIAKGIADFATTDVGHLWQRPGDERDRLCEFAAWRPLDYLAWLVRALRVPGKRAPYRPIPHPFDSERRIGAPKVFYGVIASANKLQRSTMHRNFLQNRYRAMAVEMEGSGVANAAIEFDAKFFVVRGTVDYCNEHKNKEWHYYAAIAAAAYVRALLEVTPLVPLSGRGDEPRTTTAQIGSVHDVVVTQAQEDGSTSALAANNAEEMVQRELGNAVGRLLEEEGERKLDEIANSLDAWEFRRAFYLVKDVETWIEKYKDKVSKNLIRRLYTVMVRVEIVRAKQEREEGKSLDMSRAEHYLMKAKNVSGQ